jgi:hypothetical protein
MRKTFLTVCAAAFLFAACNSKKEDKTGEASKETTNEGKTENKAWIPIDSNMMNKAWQENMTIGEQHKMLAKSNGTWTGEVTMWMADGAPAQTSTSTTITKSVYGGLYSQSNHSGNMMGMPFEGTSVMGYDNLKKEFFSTWMDNMGSGMYVMTGQWDDASKKLTLSGSTTCMNGQEATMREVFTITDNDHQTLEMYGPDPMSGKEYRNMEIKYTRKN